MSTPIQIILLFFFIFCSLISCQTTQTSEFFEEEQDSIESVGDIVESEDAQEKEGQEEEFVEDEELTGEEAEIAQEGESAGEDEEFIDEEELDGEEIAEVEDEELVDEEDSLEDEFADSEDFEKEIADPLDSGEELAGEELAGEDSEFTEEEEDALLVEDTSEVPSTTLDSNVVIVNNIQYRSGENKVYIEANAPLSYNSHVNSQNNQTIIEIDNAVLAENLKWPFVMKDFDTQISFIKADQKNSTTVRIIIQLRDQGTVLSMNISESGALVIAPTGGSGSFVATTTGGQATQGVGGGTTTGGVRARGNELFPARSLEDFFLQTPQFSGRPISLHMKNTDIREALHFISDERGLNMVVSEDVTGTISIKLTSVPWDQALITIMKTKQLGYIREGNIIRIMTLKSLREYQKTITEMIDSQKKLDVLKVKVIPIIYSEANKLQPQIESFLTKDRGKILVDTHTNALIVTDTDSVIRHIEALVKSLDNVPAQVMIEAKIVEASEEFTSNFGLSWSFDFKNFQSANLDPRIALSADGRLEVFPGLRSAPGKTVNYPFNISFAPLGSLDAMLGLSESKGLIHVVSSPRIMVLNGEEASITQSTEIIDIVTQQSSDTGVGIGTSAQRHPLLLELKVKPQITALGSIFLEISMQRDFPGAIADRGTGARPINSRAAKTRILANNGQTIVIGGIYQNDETESGEGIPILKHIPILKWLFSYNNKNGSRNELLLFLTPSIVETTKTSQMNIRK